MNDFKNYLRHDYGKGALRRRIQIDIVSDGLVTGALEDEAHAFKLPLTHDGKSVTDIGSHWVRHPTTSCSNAGEQLKTLFGHRISGDPMNLREYSDAIEHCTHFFDVANMMCTRAYCHTISAEEPQRR